MADIWDYSATADNNTSIEGINSNTGHNPGNVDNLIRAVVAVMRASLHADLENHLKNAAALAIANGGTGATTASGACSALGALEDDYRDLVRTVDKSADFTLSNSERAYGIALTGGSGFTITVPADTTGINTGAVFAIHNTTAASWSVSPAGSVTLKKNGATSSSSATLAPGATATIVKWASNYWTINGSGVS